MAELDVARVQTEVAATESEALALERQQAQLRHALAVLVGDVAMGFSLPPAAVEAALPVIPPGVPSTVLARRHDVSAAQAAVLAAQARVGLAQAAWFPALALTGSAGFASPELGDLFKWSARSWGIGMLLSLPLFDGGQRAAQEEGARARLEGALAAHRGQVLTAFREVEDQLSALRLLAGQAQAQDRAVQSAARAAQPPPGAAGAHSAVRGHGGVGARAGRGLGYHQLSAWGFAPTRLRCAAGRCTL